MEKPCQQCGQTFAKPPNVSRAAWPKRLYCSKACQYAAMRGRPNSKLGDHLRGRSQPPEHKEKRLASIRKTYAEGNVRHARANLGLRTGETSQWKGDQIGYRAAHARLCAAFGRMTECAICGTSSGPFEWALKRDAENVLAEKTGRFAGRLYSTRPEDYMPACRPCHRAYDGRERDPLTGRYL